MTMYSQLTPSRVINGNITINEPKIIHFIPDFNTNFKTYFENFPFRLANLQNIVIKSNIIKIGSISLNPKQYFIDIKKTVSKVINSIPDNINDNKFIIIDHSPIMEAISKINNISERRALFLLFNYLKNEFQYSKSIHPKVEHLVLISFNNNGLYESLLNNLNVFKSQDDLFRFFDNYVFIHAADSITSLIYYKQTKIFIDFSALNKFKNVVTQIIPSSEIITSVTPEIKIEDKLYTDNKVIAKINNINDTIIPEDQLSNSKLTKVLNTLELKDENIEKNIKIAITNQLNKKSDTTEEELNLIVLKTINKTIYGNDNVKQEYLDDPKKLINKLNIFTEYYDEIPPLKTNNNFITPNSKLISINKITGPIRHKYEFSNNIHSHVEKLFKTLENKVNPIEVLNINHEIKDNNINRYIEYNITLKNKVGFQEPYTIKLNVPYLINDKYFKLNGKEYILSSQQFLKPITKNTSTEARFISHFNMITEKLVNFKYSPSDIHSLLSYINTTYTSIVYKYNEKFDRIEFKDGTLIDLQSSIPFSHGDLELVNEHGQFHLYKNGQRIETSINKTEFIYNHLFNIINTINPNDHLKNSSRSIQYVEIHIMGAHLPLILAVWQQIGLLEALLKFGINFEISENIPENTNKTIIINLKDDKYLIIYPKSKKEEYISNGLLKLPFISSLSSTDLNERKSCYEYLIGTYGTKVLSNLDDIVEDGIDPTTKEILEFDRLPTNVIDIITGPLIDKLFNDEPDHPSDLTTLRVRMSEYMTQLMYNEIDRNCLII